MVAKMPGSRMNKRLFLILLVFIIFCCFGWMHLLFILSSYDLERRHVPLTQLVSFSSKVEHDHVSVNVECIFKELLNLQIAHAFAKSADWAALGNQRTLSVKRIVCTALCWVQLRSWSKSRLRCSIFRFFSLTGGGAHWGKVFLEGYWERNSVKIHIGWGRGSGFCNEPAPWWDSTRCTTGGWGGWLRIHRCIGATMLVESAIPNYHSLVTPVQYPLFGLLGLVPPSVLQWDPEWAFNIVVGWLHWEMERDLLTRWLQVGLRTPEPNFIELLSESKI